MWSSTQGAHNGKHTYGRHEAQEQFFLASFGVDIRQGDAANFGYIHARVEATDRVSHFSLSKVDDKIAIGCTSNLPHLTEFETPIIEKRDASGIANVDAADDESSVWAAAGDGQYGAERACARPCERAPALG